MLSEQEREKIYSYYLYSLNDVFQLGNDEIQAVTRSFFQEKIGVDDATFDKWSEYFLSRKNFDDIYPTEKLIEAIRDDGHNDWADYIEKHLKIDANDASEHDESQIQIAAKHAEPSEVHAEKGPESTFNLFTDPEHVLDLITQMESQAWRDAYDSHSPNDTLRDAIKAVRQDGARFKVFEGKGGGNRYLLTQDGDVKLLDNLNLTEVNREKAIRIGIPLYKIGD